MVKIKIAALLMCLSSLTTLAQNEGVSFINKGDWILGGNLSFSTPESLKNASFQVAPKVGHFIGKNLALGLTLSYGFDPTYNNSGVIGFGPYARYYFKSGRVAPFVEIDYKNNWIINAKPMVGSEPQIPLDISTCGIGFGLNYFVTKNIALEGVLKYDKNLRFNLDDKIDIRAGIQFFLEKRK